MRPQHIKDLTVGKDIHDPLLNSITGLVNLLLEGLCPPEVHKILFGGNLLALAKKDGGVRPIAVGSVWRRLAAKCANAYAIKRLESHLSPLQLGVGVKGGAEAAIHSARRFLQSMSPGNFMIKLDFSNAFNSLRRDSMLEAVLREIPEIYNFCSLSYAENSILFFHDFEISSEEGPQQGDPLGPLLFALALHPFLESLSSSIVLGYLDDITLGGDANKLCADLDIIESLSDQLGLSLNVKKCEIIHNENDPIPPRFANFRILSKDACELLGAPLCSGAALDVALATRCADLRRASDRLSLLSAHDALLISGACRVEKNIRKIL